MSPFVLWQAPQEAIDVREHSLFGRIIEVLEKAACLGEWRGVPPSAENQRHGRLPLSAHTVAVRKHLPEFVPSVRHWANALILPHVLAELIEQGWHGRVDRLLDSGGRARVDERFVRKRLAAACLWAATENRVLSLTEAAASSGYSAAHLARLVKQGKLRTLRLPESRGRLSFRQGDLPRKPGAPHPSRAGVHELASRLDIRGKERRYG